MKEENIHTPNPSLEGNKNRELLFVTHNKFKFQEISQVIPLRYKLISLKDIGYFEDIEETEETLEGNALLKARVIFKKTAYDCFADDTGLEVESLNNGPGVYSARYAGPKNNAIDNMNKLLNKLGNNKNRKAQFRTAIALNIQGKQYIFEGICKGQILKKQQGENGFGYDPVFKPTGFKKSFAEMDLKEKGICSHRGKAIKKLVTFLNEYTW